MLKFSFLMALYNGEKYIARCLDSLLKQDIPIDEYEIICLDDCSPDKSSDIVKFYQQKYNNIYLYKNEENCRVATNLNKLVRLARGKYFWPVGQDDFINANCLDMLWRKLETNKLDVLMFNYCITDANGKCVKDIYEMTPTLSMNGVEWIKNQYRDRNYCDYLLGYEWRAVYRTQYWLNSDIHCVDGLNWEDTVILLKAIVRSNAVASISESLYNYRRNEGSISSCSNHIKRGDYIFEFSFRVGDEVESFFYELQNVDFELAKKFNQEVKWRYNCFVYNIIITSVRNKILFYNQCKKYKSLVLQKKSWLTLKSRFFLLPIIGLISSIILKFVWKSKHAICNNL